MTGPAGETAAPPAERLEQARQLLRRQQPDAAVQHCLGLLRDDAVTGPALALLIAAQVLAGDADAAALLGLALAMAPDAAEDRRALAAACRAMNRNEDAQALLALLMADPARRPEDGHDRVELLYRLGRREEAGQVARTAAGLWPDDAETWFRLGLAAGGNGRTGEALAAYRRALAAEPEHDRAAVNLAALYTHHGRPATAVELLQAVIARSGRDDPDLQVNLGNAWAALGLIREALTAFDRAERLRPDPVSGDTAVYDRAYLDEVDAEALFAAHRRWNACYAGALPAETQAPRTHPANSREPERRLRIGYVSPDFRGHSCYFFLIPLYEAHDPAQVEIFSYANLPAGEDPCTAEFRRAGHVWRDIRGLSDQDAAEMIRRDGIDILVDLAGHTTGNRLLVFARKPAPVQVTWLGYPTTTGLDAIDWRLSDPWLTPPDTSEGFSEALWCLDRASHCYRPHAAAPEVGPLPADRNGFVTFGSANNLAKLSDGCLRLWAGVLDAVPEARLRLKSRQANAEVLAVLQRRFAAAGGDPARLELVSGAALLPGHLAQYGDIDIALDTFPYGGMTTTCEALWMGVPVLTLRGDRTASRYATAVLAGLGLEQLAAGDPGEFAAIAARLAGDRDGLRALRAGLRQRFAASPLRDEAGFARAVEAAYRGMWRRWCSATSRG